MKIIEFNSPEDEEGLDQFDDFYDYLSPRFMILKLCHIDVFNFLRNPTLFFHGDGVLLVIKNSQVIK
jgi:hypothetical protein